MKPDIEFASGSEIVTGWGIRVDGHLETSVPGIVAARDVAEVADWLTGELYVHAIFPNAVTQAPIAAASHPLRRSDFQRGRHPAPREP